LTKNIIKTEKHRLFHQKKDFSVNFAAKSALISLRYPDTPLLLGTFNPV